MAKKYIDRGSLLIKNMYGNSAPITYRTYAEALIKSAPAADVVEVVHGEWISHEGYEECDKCHAKAIYSHNYCPSCGAKMDGGRTDG